jgi:hypothetical protein
VGQTIQIHGHSRKLKVISLIKLIREATGDGLAITKDRVDGLVETGEPFDIVIRDDDSAAGFLDRAASLGAIARMI